MKTRALSKDTWEDPTFSLTMIREHEKQLTYCEVLPLLRLAERQLQFEHHQAIEVAIGKGAA